MIKLRQAKCIGLSVYFLKSPRKTLSCLKILEVIRLQLRQIFPNQSKGKQHRGAFDTLSRVLDSDLESNSLSIRPSCQVARPPSRVKMVKHFSVPCLHVFPVHLCFYSLSHRIVYMYIYIYICYLIVWSHIFHLHVSQTPNIP